MNPPFPPYCSDEDLFIEATEDFRELCPVGQVLARGLDGAFSDGWTIKGANLSWLSAGAVLLLHRPTNQPPKGLVDLGSAVDAGVVVGPSPSDPAAIVLRRAGLAPGVGQPIGGGFAGSVPYSAATLAPQIATACRDLDRRFGIHDEEPGKRHGDLVDPTELTAVAVAAVLASRYLSASSQAGGIRAMQGTTDPDNFAAKAQMYRAKYDDLIARTNLHFRPLTGFGGPAQSTRFSMRITR